MNTFCRSYQDLKHMVPATLVLALLAGMYDARAQTTVSAVCSSDGQPRPVRLVERFINADCADCWQDRATLRARPGELALDWVVPGKKDEDAPLAAVASREALERLQTLGLQPPEANSHSTRKVKGIAGGALRVAHGVALSGYIGVSMRFRPPAASSGKQGWTAWLALVESLPEGTEDSPVVRNLVRNVFQLSWNGLEQLSKKEHSSFFESRVMSVAQGANPERLQVIGWVENARGEIVAVAQSGCTQP